MSSYLILFQSLRCTPATSEARRAPSKRWAVFAREIKHTKPRTETQNRETDPRAFYVLAVRVLQSARRAGPSGAAMAGLQLCPACFSDALTHTSEGLLVCEACGTITQARAGRARASLSHQLGR
jgi:hypothetical protein